MTRMSLPLPAATESGAVISRCAAAAVSLFVAGGLWMIMA